MVSLTVYRHDSQQAPSGTTLRNSALWYPDIPGPALNINEGSCLPPRNCETSFWPLFWHSFGGPGGRDLRHLTRISFFYYGTLRRMDFFYEDGRQGTFGRHNRNDRTEATEFLIDGPGGELIGAIEVVHSSELQSQLLGCKVSLVL